MRLKRLFARLMEEAPAGGDPGAAAAATGDPAAAAAAAAAAPAAAAAGETLNPLQAAAAAAAPAVTVPEKFQVKNEDGTVNHEATALKLAESYTAAEKRIGSGEVPPKTADEYKFSVPKPLEGAWDMAADQQLKDFASKAHAAGFTQAQMDLVIETYGDLASGLVQGAQAMSAADCTKALKETWTDDATYKAETDAAARAMRAYGGDQIEPFLAKYGNDPDFIRMMAKIGHEVKEDTPLDPGKVLGNQTIEELEKSKAYTDPTDPQHASVSAKIRDYYNAKAAQDAKAGRVPIF